MPGGFKCRVSHINVLILLVVILCSLFLVGFQSVLESKFTSWRFPHLYMPVDLHPKEDFSYRIVFDDKEVTKLFSKTNSLKPMEREVCILEHLQKFHWVPRLISHSNNKIVMSNVGLPLNNNTIPRN